MVRTYRYFFTIEGAIMKVGMALFCFLLVMSLPSVRAQDVAVNFDKSIDFSKFKTYSWASGIQAKNPLIDQQIRSSIEGQLAAKGLRLVEKGGDLSVLYFVAVDRDLEVSTSSWDTTKDWMHQTATGISVRNQMWDVEVGTLMVCLSDPSTSNPLWRGTAKATLPKRSSNENPMNALAEDAKKADKKIRKSVEKMFKQYPPVRSAG
jgi:Domain of unknown function (DUF4136)